MNTLIMLMKKDWRAYRPITLATFILSTLPYVIYFSLTLVPDPRSPSPWTLAIYMPCATIGLMLTAVMAVTFAGTSIAAERRDRTLDFLNMLPPKRWQILLSKLAIAIPFLALCIAVHAAVLIGGLYQVWSNFPTGNFFSAQVIQYLIVTGLCACGTIMAFGIAWLLSTFLSSPVVSTWVAIAAAVATAAVVGQLDYMGGWSDAYTNIFWCGISLSVGVGSFIGGCVHYLRRVEP